MASDVVAQQDVVVFARLGAAAARAVDVLGGDRDHRSRAREVQQLLIAGIQGLQVTQRVDKDALPPQDLAARVLQLLARLDLLTTRLAPPFRFVRVDERKRVPETTSLLTTPSQHQSLISCGVERGRCGWPGHLPAP